jgi:hypothetical protein
MATETTPGIERTIEGHPKSLRTMLKAALPVLPGVNPIPGTPRRAARSPT